jgi:N-formylmaleamate deformylase
LILPEHWTEDFIDVKGAAFHYTRTGGSKPVLVLNHGFSDHGLCWLRVARELAAQYDIIMPDARGHGRSARVQPGEVFDRTEDMAGIFGALQLDRPIVAGHSLGAATSAQLAALHPDLLRALILEEPPWSEATPAFSELQPRPYLAMMAGIPGKMVENLMVERRANDPSYPESELQPWAESKLEFDQNLLRAASQPFMDWHETVRAIRCPTLILYGDVERGGIVSPSVAAQAAALNPLICCVHIPGAGHDVRRNNYPGFMRAVQAFLGQN